MQRLEALTRAEDDSHDKWANADYQNIHVFTMGDEERQAWDEYVDSCKKNRTTMQDPYDWHLAYIVNNIKPDLRKGVLKIMDEGRWPMVPQPGKAGKVDGKMCFCSWYALSRLYKFTPKETAEFGLHTLGQRLLLIFSDTKKGFGLMFSKKEHEDCVANIKLDDLRTDEANNRSKPKQPKTSSNSTKTTLLQKELEEKLQGAFREIVNLKEDNASLKNEVERAAQARDRQARLLTEAEANVEEADARVLSMASKKRKFQDRADDADKEVSDLKRKVGDLEGQVVELTAEKQNTKRQRTEIDQLTKDNGKLAEKNGKLAEENGKLAEENGKLAEKNGKLTEDIGKLAEKNGKLTEDNGKLAEKNGKLAEDIGKLTNEINELKHTGSRDDCSSKKSDDDVVTMPASLDRADAEEPVETRQVSEEAKADGAQKRKCAEANAGDTRKGTAERPKKKPIIEQASDAFSATWCLFTGK